MRSARGPFGHVLADLSGHEGASGLVTADLGDVHDVQNRVDLAVAADVEPVATCPTVALAGGDGQRSGTAPAGELGLGAEPARVSDFNQQLHGGDRADAADFGQ